ncbi:MAG: malate dehydrogenase [Thermoguttaceae bacterium]|nr:malate dehydrogenase [Thermoguttaceae bacterium]
MNYQRPKITVIGTGNVGATCAQYCAMRELGDVVLLNTTSRRDPPKGKALDMAESAPVFGFNVKVTNATDYEETADSSVVVVAAGMPRKPGMSRDDLLAANAEIVGNIAKNVKATSPDAVIIVVTNPVDAMVQRVFDAADFQKERVVGQAGVLDCARFRAFVAMELNVSPLDVHAMILGGHGDSMAPVVSCASVAGVPVDQLIPTERLGQIVARTRLGGGEIVDLLGTGSAYYAPAASTAKMVKSIVRDENRLLACVAYCDQEYDVGGYCIGVPVVLGAGGVKKIVQMSTTQAERTLFEKSLEAVKANVAKLRELTKPTEDETKETEPSAPTVS